MTASFKASNARAAPGAFSGFELWCVDLARTHAALCDAEQRTPRLSADDRDYAEGWKDRTVASERLATRIALRVLIERAAGAQWRGVALARHAHGKPFLHDAAVAFSLSHVAGLALIGLSAHGTIGVDLERLRPVHMRAPRRVWIEAAAAALNSAEPLPENGDERFLQAWVRLEALAKAEGCGIGRLLTRLGISARAPEGQYEGQDADRDAVQPARQTDHWRERVGAALAAAGVAVVSDLKLGEGLFAAVAAGASAEVPAVRWLPGNIEDLEAVVG